jgi:hypothetical protein
VRGEYLRPSEVSERVQESQDPRWWWTVAHNNRLPSGEFSPYDLARIRMAL